jgi:hypothetical protein
VYKIEHLPIRSGDPVTVSAAIIVGEIEKLLGVCEQDVGIIGVDIPEHDGSCSEGGGCLTGQIGPLRVQDAIFRAVNKSMVLFSYNTLVDVVP